VQSLIGKRNEKATVNWLEDRDDQKTGIKKKKKKQTNEQVNKNYQNSIPSFQKAANEMK